MDYTAVGSVRSAGERAPGEDPPETDGFEFIEFAVPDPADLAATFRRLGFAPVARHRAKAVTLYRQGDVNFLLNAEPDSFAQAFARVHGPSVCAVAFRVRDAAAAYRRLLAGGAQPFEGRVGPMELNIPAVKGIGASVIYLVDRYGPRTIYDVDFVPLRGDEARLAGGTGAGLAAVDHLTHNVHRGRMDQWAEFYQRHFGFHEISHFDIEGRRAGFRTRAVASRNGKIRIPVNEAADGKRRVETYLAQYRGEGVQHVALATEDVCAAVEALRARGVAFVDVPDAYYEDLGEQFPGQRDEVERLRADRVLVDTDPDTGRRRLLQAFTTPLVGPIFFEIIQREGGPALGEAASRSACATSEAEDLRPEGV